MFCSEPEVLQIGVCFISTQLIFTYSITYAGDIESVRFGYLDTESNFSLEFEEGQADKVFPGNSDTMSRTYIIITIAGLEVSVFL